MRAEKRLFLHSYFFYLRSCGQALRKRTIGRNAAALLPQSRQGFCHRLTGDVRQCRTGAGSQSLTCVLWRWVCLPTLPGQSRLVLTY